MLAEFAARLAIALPLVCLAAVLTLMAVRRGWLALPRFAAARPRSTDAEAHPLSIACVKSLSPAARLAVVRFQGRELLLGVSGPSVVLLASGELPATPRPSDSRPSETEPRP